MSAQHVEKVVTERVTVCDICGGEINMKAVEADPGLMGTITGNDYGKATAVVTKKPTWLLEKLRFTWPTNKMYKDRTALRQQQRDNAEPLSEPLYPEFYDFHGECLVNLVSAAIQMRKKREEERKEAEQHVAAEPATS